jgi:hypothetical protein
MNECLTLGESVSHLHGIIRHADVDLFHTRMAHSVIMIYKLSATAIFHDMNVGSSD